MKSGDVKNLAIALFFCCLMAVTVLVYRDEHKTAARIDGTVDMVSDYVKSEKARLEDPKNSKALDAAIQMGAVFNASGRELNMLVIPRAVKDLDQLDSLMAGLARSSQSLNGVMTEAERQLSENGDATKKLVEDLSKATRDTDAQIIEIGDKGQALIETASPALRELLDHANAVVVDADGTIQAYEPLGIHLSDAAGQLEGTTEDIHTWSHKMMFPPPVHGFWPKALRAGKYMLQPATDGLRLYFTVRPL